MHHDNHNNNNNNTPLVASSRPRPTVALVWGRTPTSLRSSNSYVYIYIYTMHTYIYIYIYIYTYMYIYRERDKLLHCKRQTSCFSCVHLFAPHSKSRDKPLHSANTYSYVCLRHYHGLRHHGSEGGMIRLETLIELKLFNSSFSSLSSC